MFTYLVWYCTHNTRKKKVSVSSTWALCVSEVSWVFMHYEASRAHVCIIAWLLFEWDGRFALQQLLTKSMFRKVVNENWNITYKECILKTMLLSDTKLHNKATTGFWKQYILLFLMGCALFLSYKQFLSYEPEKNAKIPLNCANQILSVKFQISCWKMLD